MHFSYSALLGTGYYTVNNPARRCVSRAAELRDSQPVARKTRYLQHFELGDLPELRFDDLVTATIMPGVEFSFRINERRSHGYIRSKTN